MQKMGKFAAIVGVLWVAAWGITAAQEKTAKPGKAAKSLKAEKAGKAETSTRSEKPAKTAEPKIETTAQTEESGRAADEAGIKAASQEFARAFEQGDPAMVAALFTEEGEYQDEDATQLSGRAAIEKAYGEFFKTRTEVKVSGTSDSIRFLGKDTALEEGTFSVAAAGEPVVSNRYSALYARQDGRWLIALLKEWSIESAEPTPSLDDLKWLIGSWETDGDELLASTTYEWTENKAFIRSRFSVTNKADNSIVTAGTQVIGFDPAHGTIRAWTFGNEGGFGEAVWSRDGNRWVIESTGTLPGGENTTALNFMTPVGEDSFTWRSVERTEAGAPQPDIGPVTVKRAAAKE